MGCCEVHSNFFYYCRYAQNKLNKLNQFGSKVGLKINTEKTKVLRLKAARPDLLKIGEKDVYLGAKVNKQGGADSEIKARIWKARTGFHKLKSVWRSSRLFSRETKINIFKTNVVAVLLYHVYGCEMWRMTKEDENKL